MFDDGDIAIDEEITDHIEDPEKFYKEIKDSYCEYFYLSLNKSD